MPGSNPAWVGTSVCLHLEGTEAPEVDVRWPTDDIVHVMYQAGAISFRGTPQEVRLALASGLAAIDRAVAERAVGHQGRAEVLAAAGQHAAAAAELERGPTP